MTLDQDDVVWVFDGRRGMAEVLTELVEGLLDTISPVVPPSVLDDHADAFEALAADDGFDATKRIHGVRLSRLFPRHVLPEHDPDAHAWEAMIRNRATTMVEAASDMLETLDAGPVVPVRERDVHTWLQVLGALRAAWHADLVDSDEPNMAATRRQIAANPHVAALLDWLAYMMEDLLGTREVCEMAGTGLDIEGIEDWHDD